MKLKAGTQMTCYNIVLTRRAKDDIINISDYITYQLMEPQTARRLVKGLRQAIKSLERLPGRFSFIQDKPLAQLGIRLMPYKNYYIFYQIEEKMNMVYVLRIGYNRKNWKAILLPQS